MTEMFVEFPKIARLNREIVVTEKIDGTNACVFVGDDGSIRAGSRTRWISPEDDNFGFARWVSDHQVELRGLGPGAHYGEWWGAGIQRRYGLSEKRFSLFNVARWADAAVRPGCCGVVPILYRGPFSEYEIKSCLDGLRSLGSVAAPGFMTPEGVVVFHTSSGHLYKVTIEKDDVSKTVAAGGRT
jgi:hypothetical protein